MERNALRCLKFGLLFDFLDFSIGSLEVLPDFVGMLLFYGSIRSHKEPAIYVLFGEVAERIRAQQPECAGRLDVIRAGMVLLPVFAFLSSAYGNNVLNIAVIFAVVALAASCTVVICGIVPERPGE